MTNDEIQRHLIENHQMLVTLAKGCLYRLRKPTVHTLEDLIQEGYMVCVHGLRDFRPQAMSPRTYIYVCAMTRFTDLIRTSWCQKRNPSGYIESARIQISEDPASLAAVHEFEENLSEQEVNFLFLNSGEPTNISVCQAMGISDHHRKKIQNRLLRKSARSF